jgi:DNA-binding response OmpR family regulator
MSSILIVEDEQHLADGLSFNLKAEGYNVEIAGDGERALELLQQRRFDAVVLDVLLPGISGFQVVSELRKKQQFVPVLILTARGRSEDVLVGFEAGADDYLPKPFQLAILLARLRGLLRRDEWAQQAERDGARRPRPRENFSFAGKTLDFRSLELRVKEKTYHLTAMETELFQYLIDRAGEAVSRKAILEDVWGLRDDTDTRAIDNFIARLRKYIEKSPSVPQHLLTVRGVGYKFVPEPKNL